MLLYHWETDSKPLIEVVPPPYLVQANTPNDTFTPLPATASGT